MNPAPARQPREVAAAPTPQSTWARRRHAAWIDYLRTTTRSDSAEYEAVEDNAWEQLQRRLRRNDELLALAMHNMSSESRA